MSANKSKRKADTTTGEEADAKKAKTCPYRAERTDGPVRPSRFCDSIVDSLHHANYPLILYIYNTAQVHMVPRYH